MRLRTAACLLLLLVAPAYADQSRRDELLREMLRQGPSFRRYGDCSYRWKWKRQKSQGTFTTTYTCDRSEIIDDTVGVDCKTLKMNYYGPVTPLGIEPIRSAWSGWNAPTETEVRMIADLCSENGY